MNGQGFAPQIVCLDGNREVGVAVALRAATLLSLEEDLQSLSDGSVHIYLVHLTSNFRSLSGPSLLEGFGVLSLHFIGGGAGAAGVWENVHIRKAAAADKVKSGGVVRLCLSGKARDKVAGQSTAGKVFSEKLHRFIEAGCIVLSVHGPESLVTAGLE